MRKWVRWVLALVLFLPLLAIPSASAHDIWGWIRSDDPGLVLTQSSRAEREHPNECEGSGFAARFNGTDPDWVRVGGSPNPSTQFVEATGQVLLDPPGGSTGSNNPRITHDDNGSSHWSQDFNVWLTLDPEDRGLLGTGNMRGEEEEDQGLVGTGNAGGKERDDPSDHREHARLEVEWERGGIPLFAWPSLGDRMTVWGAHIWDCGHEPYRTEIHPPVGWVVYRNTADADSSPCVPHTSNCSKRFRTPWEWYAAGDHRGAAAPLVGSTTIRVPIRMTVVDAFFSSFGGWTPLSLNGCRDGQPTGPGSDPPGAQDAPCSGDPKWRGWRQSLLQQDYTFFIPAPPQPAPNVRMVWQDQNRCLQTVPASPANPPGDDIEDVGEAGILSHAHNLGAPSCTIPDIVHETTVDGRRGLLVTVNAKDPSVTYRGKGYMAFAHRFRVGWAYVPPASERARTYEVNFEKLRVYEDQDVCGEDGEWVMSLAVNEQWIHPVRGHGDGGDAFWENGAIDDALCGDPDAYNSYRIDERLRVTVLPGEDVHVFERSFDLDVLKNDANPVINAFIAPTPGMNRRFVSGVADDDVDGAHTIVYTVRDVTVPVPDLDLLTTPTSFRVRNVGDGLAGHFVVRVSGVGDFTFPRLDPGATQTRSFGCSTTTRTATADANADVVEAWEGNNTAAVPPCPLPDLIISDSSATSFTVTNRGDGPAGPFVVTVSGVGDFGFDGLDAGASAFRELPCSETRRRATADPSNQVQESDETNNRRKVPGGVCTSPTPDLVISEADAVHFVVKNVGTAAAGPFVVSVAGSADFSFGGLAAGASETRSLPCSEFDRTVTADSGNQVAESDETNNTRTAPGTIC